MANIVSAVSIPAGTAAFLSIAPGVDCSKIADMIGSAFAKGNDVVNFCVCSARLIQRKAANCANARLPTYQCLQVFSSRR